MSVFCSLFLVGDSLCIVMDVAYLMIGLSSPSLNDYRLERRFFDRVAQTNRVKSSGVATTLAPGATMIGGPTTMNLINVGGKLDTVDMEMKPPTPPWLRPPRTYKPKGKFARKLMMNKAAMNALSRYMPQKPMTDSMPGKRGSGVQTSMTSDGIPRTESALEQLARTASGERTLVFHVCTW